MITYRLGFYQAEPQRAEELIRAIKRHPGSCDTVWLTSMGYYPPLSKHEQYADDWVPIAKMFRDAGIRVSMQIANTIGHGDWEQLRPENRNFFIQGMLPKENEDPYLVGPDGTKNISCFCWRSPQLIAYISEVVKIYAQRIHPDRLWFDDDLRAHHHHPNHHACYCDRCIAAFNRQNESAYTREELVRRIHCEDIDLRQRYIDFIREGLYQFTNTVAKASLSVAPDTNFGLEYEHTHNYHGANDEHLLGALHDAGGKDVQTRPGGLHYNDKSPWGQYEKALALSAANSLLPPYVGESIAEIENLPGVVWGKSIGGILNEGTIDLAVGCTGLSFTDVQSCHESMQYYEKIFAAFSAIRPYWKRLSEIAKNSFRGGVAIYWGEAPQRMPLSESAPFCAWDRVLQDRDINLTRLGVPLTYDQRMPSAYLLHHTTVDAMTDRDIEFLLKKPVITDGECVAKLCARGFAHRFSLRPEPIDDLTEEYFTDSPINGEKAGMFYNENPYAAEPMQRYVFRDLDENSEVLGNAYGDHFIGTDQYIGPCTLITDIRDSDAKWAIFGYSLWSDIVSSAKRNQIIGALDAIATMPARLTSEEQAVIIPSVDRYGRTVSVTLGSASQSGTEDLVLIVRNPRGNQISLMGARRDTVTFKIADRTAHTLSVHISPLLPYEVVTLFFDEIQLDATASTDTHLFQKR